MRRSVVVSLLPAILLLGASLAHAQKQPGDDCTRQDSFPTTCNPFKSMHHRAIDNTCGLTGDAGDPNTDGNAAQDKVKNNLCGSEKPTEITIDDLKNLQDSVDGSGLVYGNTHVIPPAPPPPVDRNKLFGKAATGDFAEGDLVAFVGYIAETKAGGAESVNCHCNGVEYNDIHVALAPHTLHLQKAPKNASKATRTQITTQNNEALCTDSFTAEVIPHLRPVAFTRTTIDKLIDAKVVRVSGQLMFDASHHPCGGTTPIKDDPARFTSWEIHPIYSIQVCRNNALDQCPADDPSVWKDLGQSQ